MSFSRYNANWSKGTSDLEVEMYCIRKGGRWKIGEKQCGEGLSFHYERMRQILWPNLEDHRWNSLIRDTVIANKVTVLMGAASCVHADTRIPNVATGEAKTIRELCDQKIAPVVMTVTGPVQAEVPFIAGKADLFEVVLSNGSRFTCTGRHRVLTSGGFAHVERLQIGQSLFSYAQVPMESNLGPGQLDQVSSAPDSPKTTEGSPVGYHPLFHSCDEQLRSAIRAYQSSLPLQFYAHGRSHDDCDSDDRAAAVGRSHSYQSLDHPSSSSAFRTSLTEEIRESLHACEEISEQCCVSLQLPSRSPSVTPSRNSSETLSPRSVRKPSACDSYRVGISGRISSTPPEWIESQFQTLSKAEATFCPSKRLDKVSDSSLCSVQSNDSLRFMVQQAQVVSITKTHQNEDYYDITVPGVEHYFAEGGIHHNTGKTHSAAWLFLCEYFCFPEETCVLVSSTDMGGLRLRVWGEINKLWSEAVNRFPELPGHLIDSRLLIATDDLSEYDMDEVRVTRDWRKGIKGVATVQGAKYVGLGKYVGIKQKRMRLIADEAQFMPHTFLSAMANLDKNEDFKAIILGNPLDPTDALGKAAEPVDGWVGHMEPKKTEVWNTKNGKCINLVGTDSPNFDFPDDQPTRYRYLISREKIAFTLMSCPKDSIEYYSQCMGVMKIGVLSRRILTRDMCRQFGAMTDVVWSGGARTRILALDAAYGGDRCITGYVEFGPDVNNNIVVKVGEPVEIPIIVREDQTPEDQISHYLKNYALSNDIKPENFFYDSTGRGSLGTSLARIWSNLCNPVEFGGRPTARPVSLDHHTDDEETKLRRLKRCDEHYDRFVSELAFSVRYVVEGAQMRTLPVEVMEEFCDRKWDLVKGNKISIEPKTGTATKPGFKQRIGRSCDLADWLSIAIEGARQRGFEIKKLGSVHVEENEDNFFAEEAKRYENAIKSNLLTH